MDSGRRCWNREMKCKYVTAMENLAVKFRRRTRRVVVFIVHDNKQKVRKEFEKVKLVWMIVVYGKLKHKKNVFVVCMHLQKVIAYFINV